MAVLTPESDGESLVDAQTLRLGIGGAESNVAMGLAAMGLDTHWVSRVGDDPFGDRICRELQAHGVGTQGVEVDPRRPTGLYIKTPNPEMHGSSNVLYYREGSAASAMDGQTILTPTVETLIRDASLVHLSGITAALSTSCQELCQRILELPRSGKTVSFDVNWRKSLWTDQDPGLLIEMANMADIVLMGGDEAQEVFGTGEESALRSLLPNPDILVVKNADVSAVALLKDGRRYETKALAVEVVEPVGAGDAFAAGYLTGILRDFDQQACLRLGHVSAACTLTVRGDRGPLPGNAIMSSLLEADERNWGLLRVSRGRFYPPMSKEIMA